MTAALTSFISDLQECLAGSVTATQQRPTWGHVLAQVKHSFKIKPQVPLKIRPVPQTENNLVTNTEQGK